MAESTDFDWDELFDGVNWFHWTGINPALFDNMVQICERFGCKKVAITLRETINASHNGWSGMLYDVMGNVNYSTHYNIDIVDQVGGDDSFTGAMIYSLITGKDNKDAIKFAVAASCLKHSMEGDFNRVTVSDVENLIKNGGNGRVQH